MSNSNEPSKLSGQYNSAMGSVKEAAGQAYDQLTGQTVPSALQRDGKEQHAKGEAEIKAAETQQYAEGLGDRVEGKFDSVAGAVTGDKTKQAKGNVQHDKGQAQMNANS